MADQQIQDPSSSNPWYIQNRIMKMSDEKAKGNIGPAYEYFEDALQSLLPHMEIAERQAIQRDWERFKDQRHEIIYNPKLNEASQVIELNKLKRSFMENHMVYLSLAQARARMLKVQDDGDIDFTKLDYDKVKDAIRSISSLGLKGTVKKHLEGNDGNEPLPDG